MPSVKFCQALALVAVVSACCLPSLAIQGQPNADSTPSSAKAEPDAAAEKPKKREKIVKTDVEWRKQLSKKQYDVARKGETERAFTGRYWKHKAKGMYLCVCCDQPLFHSSTKYKSGTGWPSFFAPIDDENIAKRIDRTLFFEVRTEVLCSRCDAHLGHVFADGPRPTGLRYCLNSAALKFEADEKKGDEQQEDRQQDDAGRTSDSVATKRSGNSKASPAK